MKPLNILLSVTLSLALTGCHAGNEYSNHLSKQELTQAVLKDMVFVKGGKFVMYGSPPSAKVTLTDYYLDKYAVPFYQFKSYKILMGKKVNQTVGDREKIFNGMFPARATFKQATNFCHWVGKQIHMPTALVTHAQWEYAARSRGTDVIYPTNNGTLEPGVNIPGAKSFKTFYLPVNSFPPNPLGMHLMTGNGFEWVKNWYAGTPGVSMTNPQGPATGYDHMVVGTTMSDTMLAFTYGPGTNNQGRSTYRLALSVKDQMWITPGKGTDQGYYHFRCAINSGKPLPTT